MNENKGFLYLLVSEDEYELILDFDTSPERLAKRHGVKVASVRSGAYYSEKKGGKGKWRRIRL